jgi:hypothetical protein
MKCLLLILVTITSILSYPTPIRRNGKSPSCVPNACIDEPTFCFCGFEKSPNDPCCEHTCSVCPANFTLPGINFQIGPLNFFPLGAFNLSGLNLSFLG